MDLGGYDKGFPQGEKTPTLNDLTKLMKAFVESTTKAMEVFQASAGAKTKAGGDPYDTIAKAMNEQLERSHEMRIPGRRAYNAFKDYRSGLHTPTQWNEPTWRAKWEETYKSRARAGILTPHQTIMLSILTDPDVTAEEMRNLLAVLALLPADKVLPFYNFTMYEGMGLEGVDALEHLDTIPVPLHNPKLLADLNSKTIQEYVTWLNTPAAYEGYGALQRPFSMYADETAFGGQFRSHGAFDRSSQVQQKPRGFAGSGVADVPLIAPSRLAIHHAATEPKNGTRANNQKLAQDK